MNLKYKYFAPADDNGSDLPGDRGDLLPEDVVTPPDTDEQAEKDAEEILGKEVVEDEKDEPPRDEKGKFAKKEAGIPKERFDEAVNKERQAREAAERRAAELESRIQQADVNEEFAKAEQMIEGLESKHAQLLLDGEVEKAAALMKQIRHSERELTEARMEARSSRATSQAVEEVRMEATIAKLEADYPALNTESETFDQDLVDLVLAKQAALIQNQRMTPSKALAEAAKVVMKKMAPAPAVEPDNKGLSAAKTSDRKTEQVTKNIDTAKRQPADMKQVGVDSDKSGGSLSQTVEQMTSEEWGALPASTKAKLRGDFA